MIGAPQALACGLINDAASQGESLDDALERFTAPIRQQAPQVLRAFKALRAHENGRGREELDEIETVRFSETWAHPDHDSAVERLMNRME
jgi:enoyl-CoA hydratase/carnithine racemase